MQIGVALALTTIATGGKVALADPVQTSLEGQAGASAISSPALMTVASPTSGRPLSLSSGALLLPITLTQGGSLAPTTGGPSRGVSFFYFTPGSGTDLAGNPVISRYAPTTFGLTQNLTFGPAASANGHGGTLQFSGRYFGSNEAGTSNSQRTQQEALSQNISYKSQKFTAAFSFLDVGKQFGGDAGVRQFASSGANLGQSADINALLGAKGKRALNFSLGYGTDATGAINFAHSDLSDSNAHTKSTEDKLALGFGNLKTGKVAFQYDNLVNGSSKTLTNDLKVSLDRNMGGGVSLSLGHEALRTGPSTGVGTTTTTDHVLLAMAPTKSGLGLGVEETRRRLSTGSAENIMRFRISQTVSKFNFGADYLSDSTTGLGAVTNNVMTYQVGVQPTKTLGVALKWIQTDNTLAMVQHQTEQDLTLTYSPIQLVQIQAAFSDASNRHQHTLTAAFKLPHLVFLNNAVWGANVTAQSATTAAPTEVRKLHFDALLPGHMSGLTSMLNMATVHVESNANITGAMPNGTALGHEIGVRTVKLASSAAAYKPFQWSATFSDPYNTAGPSAPEVTDYEIDVPVTKSLTANFISNTHILQPDGFTVQNTDQHIYRLTGRLAPKSMVKLAAELNEGTDFGVFASRHTALAFSLLDDHDPNHAFHIGFELKRQNAKIGPDGLICTYRLGFNLASDTNNKLSLDSTVSTYAHQVSFGGLDHTDILAQLAYASQFE